MASKSSMSENERKRELQEFDDSKSGVKGLEQAGRLQEIPRIFIDEQYALERKSTSDQEHELDIPVIDLGRPSTDDRGRIVDQVRDACEEWGFEETVECVRRFHELEAETKKEYYSRDFKKKVLYNSNFDLHQAPSANWRDTLYMIMAPHPPQPHELPLFAEVRAMLEYSEQVKKLGIILFELMSEALGLNPNRLKEM